VAYRAFRETVNLAEIYSRIAVLGISGSGKTTFAQKLGEKMQLPVYHMDQLFWGPSWQETPADEWKQQEKVILNKDQWILEGYIDETCPDRMARADLIIYLDFSGWVCALNGLKRWWRYRFEPRPEMAEGCTEKLDLRYLWVMLARKERSAIEEAIKTANHQNVIRLRSLREANEYCEDFKIQNMKGQT